MKTGHVKWFCADKGYGFIEPEQSCNHGDIFIHLTALERSGLETITAGQRVQFHTEVDKRKGKETISHIILL